MHYIVLRGEHGELLGHAMTPPRALSCEKIHPFHLHRYFCVETLDATHVMPPSAQRPAPSGLQRQRRR